MICIAKSNLYSVTSIIISRAYSEVEQIDRTWSWPAGGGAGYTVHIHTYIFTTTIIFQNNHRQSRIISRVHGIGVQIGFLPLCAGYDDDDGDDYEDGMETIYICILYIYTNIRLESIFSGRRPKSIGTAAVAVPTIMHTLSGQRKTERRKLTRYTFEEITGKIP